MLDGRWVLLCDDERDSERSRKKIRLFGVLRIFAERDWDRGSEAEKTGKGGDDSGEKEKN